MVFKIHHPDPRWVHHSTLLFAQVHYDGGRRLSGHITEPGGGDRLRRADAVPLGNNRFGLLFNLAGLQQDHNYTLHIVERGGGEQPVTFKYHLRQFADPALSWPLSGDTVTDVTFAAYGTANNPLDDHFDFGTGVYDHQTLGLSQVGQLSGHELPTAAVDISQSGNFFYVTFMEGENNGEYRLTVLDQLGNPAVADPVIVNVGSFASGDRRDAEPYRQPVS